MLDFFMEMPDLLPLDVTTYLFQNCLIFIILLTNTYLSLFVNLYS